MASIFLRHRVHRPGIPRLNAGNNKSAFRRLIVAQVRERDETYEAFIKKCLVFDPLSPQTCATAVYYRNQVDVNLH